MQRPPAVSTQVAKEAKSKPRRLRRSERTLVCFIQALQGMRLVIELRQDTIVRGVLESADEDMNLLVTGATYSPLQGEKQELQWLYIKGHHIRYVHIPSKVDPARVVEQNKRRISQLRLMHNREIGQLPALPKGAF